MTGRRYRILIVDDHPIVRRGLRDLIALQADMEVCGEAADVAEALRLVETTRPDLVIVDLYLKNGHGIQLIERIKARNDRMKMLVSSMHDEMVFAERVLRAGAMGYITKQESTDALLEAIRRLLRGEVYLSPRMANRLLRGRGRRPAPHPRSDPQPLESRNGGVRDDRPRLDDPANRPRAGTEPQDRRDLPRKDQGQAQSQEQRRTLPPRHSVDLRTAGDLTCLSLENRSALLRVRGGNWELAGCRVCQASRTAGVPAKSDYLDSSLAST